MPPKQFHRGTRSRKSTTGIGIDWTTTKDSKRRKTDITCIGIECAQTDVCLSTARIITPNKDNVTTDIKRTKKSEESLSDDYTLNLNSGGTELTSFNESIDSHSNITSRKFNLRKQSFGKTKVNLRTLNLSNSPIVSGLASYRSTNDPKVSSSTVSSATKLNSSKTSRSPRTSTLVGNSRFESQGDGTFCNGNDVRLKLHVTDTDVSLDYGSLNHDTSTVPEKPRNKSVPLVGTKYGSRKLLRSARMALSSTKTKLRKPKLANSTVPTVGCFPYGSNKRIPRMGENDASFNKSYNARETNSINITKDRNIDAFHFFKKNSFTVTEPIVLLQRLCNIVTVVSSPTRPVRSLSTSMVRIHIDDRFADSSVNVSRKTCDSVLDCTQETTNSYNKANKTISRKKRKKAAACAIRENTVAFSPQNLGSASEASPGPKMSSTPKDRQRLNETRTDKFEGRKISNKLDTTLQLNTCDTFVSGGDVGENINKEEGEEVKGNNDTYDLIEPKTPNLRKRQQEERLVDNEKKIARKNFKVRFTNPSLDTSDKILSQARYREKRHPGGFASMASNNSMERNILKPDEIRVTRKRSNSCSSQVPFAVHSLTPSSRFPYQANSSVNVKSASILPFASRVTKSDPKCFSTPKKVPNFVDIHKKMFARSESVVDAKKRLKDRHAALTTTKVSNSLRTRVHTRDGSKLPSEPNLDTYNRFGFKMRTHEVPDRISKSNNSHLIRCKQQNRAILKGVRTNRRFELQMQSRNIQF